MPQLIRAIEIVRACASPTEPPADHLVLTYEERHRRRMRYVGTAGTIFLLDLPRATVLRAGDALRLEDGRMIRIEAAPEALFEVTASDLGTLIRLAWHIGNRHLPAQLEPHRILIREDPVIGAMLEGLGASVTSVHAPFSPEPGAYTTAAADPAAHPHSRADHHDGLHGGSGP